MSHDFPQPALPTRAVHDGAYPDSTFGSVVPPIYPSSTFRWADPEVVPGIDYARCNNPTRDALQISLASLEGGAAAVACSSGMAAIHTLLLTLSTGDHVICGHDAYAGTYRLFDSVLRRCGFSFSFVDMREPELVRAAIRPETRMIWVETPSNPLMQLTDIRAVVALAREVGGIKVAVDNTFLTPALQRPLELGADYVVHSTTKFLNGHSDAIGGAVVAADPEDAEKLRKLITAIGSGQGPFESYLIHRGIRSLVARIEVHQRNARAVAEWLVQQDGVAAVYYPGLKEHPQASLAAAQQDGPGGMLSFTLDPTRIAPLEVARSIKVFQLAVSLGGTESLLELPWYMSHHGLSEAERTAMDVTPNLIRLSPGLEATEDLIADLDQAFAKARKRLGSNSGSRH